jgi:hypothetical protein
MMDALAEMQSPRGPRQMRFPPALEAAFQEDYYRQIVPMLRAGMLLMVVTMAAQMVSWLEYSGPTPLLLLVGLFRLLAFVVGLGLTFRKGFWRCWQAAYAAVRRIVSISGSSPNREVRPHSSTRGAKR